MPEPVSLSVGKISAAAKASVEKALAQHKTAFPTIPHYRLGYIPPHWWFGFVVYNQHIDRVTFGDAEKLAGEVLKGVSASVPGVKGGKAGVAFDDGGYLTIGFAPPINVNVLEA